MANNAYDVVILGGGIGGYVAALRASQLGMRTAIVEKDKIGGTCLHRGCIPSKTLLKSAEVYQLAKTSDKFGIEIENVTLNYRKVQIEKNNVIEQLYQGLLQLMKKGKIDIYYGKGRILGPSIFSPLPGAISIEMNDGNESEIIVPKNLIIATGSKPRALSSIPFDGQFVLSTDEALSLSELPKSMIIIGGGVIGIEWASMLSDFGVEVTIVEAADKLLPMEDEDISIAISSHLKNKGIHIVTEANVLSHEIQNHQVVLSYEEQNEKKQITADKLLVAIGRQAAIDDIGLENTDIVVSNQYIQTNQYYQTAESHIYAIGDCIGGMQLAHVAAKEGYIAIEHIAGLNPEPLRQENVVRCVYSNPEIASIGLTEQEAKTKNYNIKIGKIPFRSNSKALIHKHTSGFAKFIADADTDDILGVHMIGYQVTELISELALAKVLDATPWEVSQAIHPHPSLSEIIGEAALAVDGIPLHF